MEMLLRTGLWVSEYTGLPAGAVVLIGAGPWLHVPIGKLCEDRFLPLHPQLVKLLDEYRTAHVPRLSAAAAAPRVCFRSARPRLGFLERGERLRGLGVRSTQEPPPWPGDQGVLDDTCGNLIQIAHQGGARSPPVQTAPSAEAGPSATSIMRGS